MTDPAHASHTPEQMERASKIARRVLADKVWKEARQRFINDATQADFEAHLVVVAGMHAALTAILQSDQQQAELLRLEWRDGPPPKPWAGEWFIAETTYGDRVCLTALPEEYTYDFKTADDTYIKADKIKRWMQFPDSEYIAPYNPEQAELKTLAEAMAEYLEQFGDAQHLTDAFREWQGGRSDGPEPGSADWLKQSPNFHPGDLA